MRRLILAALLVIGAPAAGFAQPGPSEGLIATPPSAPAAPAWAQDPEPGSHQRKPEVRTGAPSGFWTSTRPARGGAYRWRILACGVAVLALTIFLVVRMLRRTSRARLSA